MKKAYRATDVVRDKLKFPCIVMPKIDGVRMLAPEGQFVARTMKDFKNARVAEVFDKVSDHYNVDLSGCDGELIYQCDPTADDLCSLTTGMINRKNGEVNATWFLFDDFTNPDLPYHERLELVTRIVLMLEAQGCSRIRVVPHRVVHNMDDYMECVTTFLELGYEGAIVRDPDAPYKFGRSTVKEGGYLRDKPFIDAEIEVTAVLEGATNTNEATKRPDGVTERSSKQAGKVANGMVGTIVGRLLKDVEWNGKVILKEGLEVEVSPGKLSHAAREYYWNYPDEIIGQYARFQMFPIGVKDKPRFPTFQSFRAPEDIMEVK